MTRFLSCLALRMVLAFLMFVLACGGNGRPEGDGEDQGDNTVQSNNRVSLQLPEEDALPFKNCIGQDNQNSTLTWCSSYELMAYLARYRASGSLDELGYFLVHALDVLSVRDSETGLGDQEPVWSSTNYTEGVPYPTAVSTGMIAYPLADFAFLVQKQEPHLQKVDVLEDETRRPLIDYAADMQAAAELAVAAHEDQWNSFGSYRALSETSDFFFDSGGMPMADAQELPFNMSAALGRAFVRLFQVSDEPTYEERARALASRFRSWISYNPEGYPYWLYWTAYPGGLDDTSHASISVDFARLMYEAGLGVFERDELTQFGRVFGERMLVGEGEVSLFVDGTGESRDSRDAMSWTFLSPYFLNVKYVAIDAHRLGANQSRFDEGYGSWGDGLVLEFGGREEDGAPCTRSSTCLSSYCEGLDFSKGESSRPEGRCAQHP